MIAIEEYRARIGCFNPYRKTSFQTSSKSQRIYFSEDNGEMCFRELMQTLIFFIFILTSNFDVKLKSNINMAFLKMAMLLQSGDIESNPGPPYKIEKAVLGTFHQGHPKFGDTSGIQCACNALYAICFSLVKKISIW